MNEYDARSRLILALDVSGDIGNALSWVARLKDHVGMFKIGKEAFTSFGPELVRNVQKNGGRVFLDLKFHDIPNTVSRAAEAATLLGVAMFNVHALGGRKMMQEAVQAAKRVSDRQGLSMPLVQAVTVLTSLGDDDMADLGFHDSSTQRIAVHLAKLAQEAGLSGVVASAQEIEGIREACGEDFIIVTPGIRQDNSVCRDDQKRSLTPEEAIRKSADFLVVGRPIMSSQDPVAAADKIVEAIEDGLKARTKIHDSKEKILRAQ